jgi:hypothetical protein
MTESEKAGSPKCVAAAAMLVVINFVVLATTSKPHWCRGGYLFSSGSIFGSSSHAKSIQIQFIKSETEMDTHTGN